MCKHHVTVFAILFYTPPDPVIKVVFHCSGPSNATKLTQNYSNKSVADLSLSFNVHSLHPIDQVDLLAVVELQTSAFSFPSRGAGG